MIARLAARRAAACPGGGLVVCAVDTELFGHWWYEGPAWLRAVVEECARQGLDAGAPRRRAARRIRAGAARPRGRGMGAEQLGRGGDLSTWSSACAGVAEMAFAARAAELERAAGGRARRGGAALRELLALQSSDWAFMVSRGARRPLRARALRRATARALGERARARAAARRAGGLRNLAVHADPALLARALAEAAHRAATPSASRAAPRACGSARAGTPPTTALAGTSRVTTAFVPTMLLSPMLTPRRTQAP